MAKETPTQTVEAEDTSGYEEHYSDDGFWDKTKNYAKVAGESVLEPALKLYYAAQEPDTPGCAKASIYGALGYFISPIDALPDITPLVGYTDDMAVLLAAVAVTAAHITPKVSEKARETMKRWFG